MSDVRLPSRITLHGLTSSEPSLEFIENRQQELNRYLEDLIKCVGFADSGFWHHPITMTFLDIPLSSNVTTKKMELLYSRFYRTFLTKDFWQDRNFQCQKKVG